MDLYQTLGVAKDAPKADIKKAFRKLARELHPDRNPGDATAEKRFKDVNRAYQVLSDDEKRKLYDEFGELSLQQGFDANRARQAGVDPRIEELFRRAAAGQGVGGGAQQVFNIEDLLGGAGIGDIFGNSRRRKPQRGADLESELSIGFVEALRGTERELRVSHPSGPRDVKVRIPAGVRDGGKVRLKGQGTPSRFGGEAGDLVLTVRVELHPHFWREGEDLHLRVPVTALEAYEGTKVQIPTLDGDVALRVPAGTPSGTKLRLRGKGAKRGVSTGDLFAHVEITLPPAGDAQVADHLRELEGSYPPMRSDLSL